MFYDNVNAKVAKIANRKKSKQYQINLADSIVHLLNSPDLCKKISKGARNTYEEKYTIEEMRRGYKKLIESL